MFLGEEKKKMTLGFRFLLIVVAIIALGGVILVGVPLLTWLFSGESIWLLPESVDKEFTGIRHLFLFGVTFLAWWLFLDLVD